MDWSQRAQNSVCCPLAMKKVMCVIEEQVHMMLVLFVVCISNACFVLES